MQCRRRKLRQRGGIGARVDLSPVARLGNEIGKEGVRAADAVGQERLNGGINGRLRRRGRNRVAPARRFVSRLIHVERRLVKAPEKHSQRRIIGQQLQGERPRLLAIAFKRLEIKVALHPDHVAALCTGAAAYALLHRLDDARRLIVHIRELQPQLRVSTLRGYSPFQRPADLAAYEQALRTAGLPE